MFFIGFQGGTEKNMLDFRRKMRYNDSIKKYGGSAMRSKQKIGWILLCVAVCLIVAVAILAVLPAWETMGDMSAWEAILYCLKNGIPKVE